MIGQKCGQIKVWGQKKQQQQLKNRTFKLLEMTESIVVSINTYPQAKNHHHSSH